MRGYHDCQPVLCLHMLSAYVQGLGLNPLRSLRVVTHSWTPQPASADPSASPNLTHAGLFDYRGNVHGRAQLASRPNSNPASSTCMPSAAASQKHRHALCASSLVVTLCSEVRCRPSSISTPHRPVCVHMHQRATLVVGQLREGDAKLGGCHSQAALAPTVLQGLAKPQLGFGQNSAVFIM